MKCCSKKEPTEYLKVSWTLTWTNFIISSIGIFVLWIHKGLKLGSFIPFFGLSDPLIFFAFADTFVSIPLLIFNFFTLLLLQLLPKCKTSCCQFCQKHCYPVHQMTALDPNQPFELIEWSMPVLETNVELLPTQNSNSTKNVRDNVRNLLHSQIRVPVLPRFPDISACN